MFQNCQFRVVSSSPSSPGNRMGRNMCSPPESRTRSLNRRTQLERQEQLGRPSSGDCSWQLSEARRASRLALKWAYPGLSFPNTTSMRGQRAKASHDCLRFVNERNGESGLPLPHLTGVPLEGQPALVTRCGVPSGLYSQSHGCRRRIDADNRSGLVLQGMNAVEDQRSEVKACEIAITDPWEGQKHLTNLLITFLLRMRSVPCAVEEPWIAGTHLVAVKTGSQV